MVKSTLRKRHKADTLRTKNSYSELLSSQITGQITGIARCKSKQVQDLDCSQVKHTYSNTFLTSHIFLLGSSVLKQLNKKGIYMKTVSRKGTMG